MLSDKQYQPTFKRTNIGKYLAIGGWQVIHEISTVLYLCQKRNVRCLPDLWPVWHAERWRKPAWYLHQLARFYEDDCTIQDDQNRCADETPPQKGCGQNTRGALASHHWDTSSASVCHDRSWQSDPGSSKWEWFLANKKKCLPDPNYIYVRNIWMVLWPIFMYLLQKIQGKIT